MVNLTPHYRRLMNRLHEDIFDFNLKHAIKTLEMMSKYTEMRREKHPRMYSTAKELKKDPPINISRTTDIFSEKELIAKVLETLPPRDRKVVALLYGMGDGSFRTFKEVGKLFNVTIGRVRQIEARALRKLRHPCRSKILKEIIHSGFFNEKHYQFLEDEYIEALRKEGHVFDVEEEKKKQQKFNIRTDYLKRTYK